MVKAEEVRGVKRNIPPILRMSCSPLRLWMIEPAAKKSMALKKACVEMCMKARWGWFNPIATIISPSWLVVEKAMIFLMSFWLIAQRAAKSEVKAPKQRHTVRATVLVSISGWMRMSRKTPAITIVLE